MLHTVRPQLSHYVQNLCHLRTQLRELCSQKWQYEIKYINSFFTDTWRIHTGKNQVFAAS